MTLDTYADPAGLYLARGEEVNLNRPIFTGDVFDNVAVPGVQDNGAAIVLAHPCSFRGGAGKMHDHILLAAVTQATDDSPVAHPARWTEGYYNRMPLPELPELGHCVAWLDRVGMAETALASQAHRIACLSEVGINMLQQRLTFHLTRVAIPTYQFQEAFEHTMVEAELLEEWIDVLTEVGYALDDATAGFEKFIRSGSPSWQEQLLDPQRRAAVRRACHKKAMELVQEVRGP